MSKHPKWELIMIQHVSVLKMKRVMKKVVAAQRDQEPVKMGCIPSPIIQKFQAVAVQLFHVLQATCREKREKKSKAGQSCSTIEIVVEIRALRLTRENDVVVVREKMGMKTLRIKHSFLLKLLDKL
ncbi:hypothetical protein ACS0TY_007340 [Phlomoides rotata]